MESGEIGGGEGSGRGVRAIGRDGEVQAAANSGQVDKTQRAADGGSALPTERGRDREPVRRIGRQGADSPGERSTGAGRNGPLERHADVDYEGSTSEGTGEGSGLAAVRSALAARYGPRKQRAGGQDTTGGGQALGVARGARPRPGAGALDRLPGRGLDRTRHGGARRRAHRRLPARGGPVEAGLLERLALLCSEPAILRASAAGLRYAGLGMSVARSRRRRSTTGCAVPPRRSCSRRSSGRALSCPSASLPSPSGSRAAAGERPVRRRGSAETHRPDLAVIARRPVIAVEVELSAKAPRRLEAIMRGWRRASWVDRGPLLLRAGTDPAGGRASLAATHCGERVFVFEAVAR